MGRATPPPDTRDPGAHARDDDETAGAGDVVAPDAVALTLPVSDGRRLAFLVDEARQGNRDLNGDGDAGDAVLHVYDADTRTARNLGAALTEFATLVFEDGYLLFAVSELGQGGVDLDGDGVVGGSVLAVYDAERGTTRSTGLRVQTSAIDVDAGQAGFFALESAATGDLNGDGDELDQVFHLVDVKSGATANIGLAGQGFLLAEAGSWSIGVQEAAQGGMDLDGDGDATSSVFFTVDGASGAAFNTGLSSFFGSFSAKGQERFALSVDEASAGADLNGDGDRTDVVPALVDPARQLVEETGLAIGSFTPSFLRGWAVFGVSERAQGFQDLNGDGDIDDDVLHVWDLATGVLQNLGVEARRVVATEEEVAFLREEASAGADLNGDGDRADLVVHVWDSRDAAVQNVRWSALNILDARGPTVLFVTSEQEEGVDLNGDGDLEDFPLVYHDRASGYTASLGVIVSQAVLASPAVLYALESEPATGADLNGDGDVADSVLRVIELAPPPPGRPAKLRDAPAAPRSRAR